MKFPIIENHIVKGETMLTSQGLPGESFRV